jgi:hypothetical protein
MGQGDLLYDAPYAQHTNSVAHDKGSRQNDAESSAIIGEQALNG